LKELRGGHEGRGLRIGIIVSRFNERITNGLLEGALKALKESGVADEDLVVVSVPGAFEIPGAAHKLASAGGVDAIVCLGAVIRGETEHFTYISKAAQEGIVNASLATGVPMTFGVLTTNDFDQALDRIGGAHGHKGQEAALDAIEMANLFRLIN